MRIGIAILALGTVPAFAQQQPMTTQQWLTTVPYHGPDKGIMLNDQIDCQLLKMEPDGTLQCAGDSPKDGESVNDPIPSDAVEPLYRDREPYCPTAEYRVRWFVVTDFEGKRFDARCVSAK